MVLLKARAEKTIAVSSTDILNGTREKDQKCNSSYLVLKDVPQATNRSSA